MATDKQIQLLLSRYGNYKCIPGNTKTSAMRKALKDYEKSKCGKIDIEKVMEGEYFKNDKELYEHLINGGIIRPYFSWYAFHQCIFLGKDGNKTYLSGESAEKCTMSIGHWIKL